MFFAVVVEHLFHIDIERLVLIILNDLSDGFIFLVQIMIAQMDNNVIVIIVPDSGKLTTGNQINPILFSKRLQCIQRKNMIVVGDGQMADTGFFRLTAEGIGTLIQIAVAQISVGMQVCH